MSERPMTSTEKIVFVAMQIAGLEPGDRPKLHCPYCGGCTRRGEIFCCELMLACVDAVLDANNQIQVTEMMDRILERHLNN